MRRLSLATLAGTPRIHRDLRKSAQHSQGCMRTLTLSPSLSLPYVNKCKYILIHLFVSAYTYLHVYICMYIYIYICVHMGSTGNGVSEGQALRKA